MAGINISEIKSAVSKYVRELERLGVHTEKVILYGSYAKGSAGIHSDIDIVVVSRELAKWPPIERLQFLARATINIDAPLEVLGYTPDEIRKFGKKSILWEEVTKTGKEIYKKAA